MFTQKTQKTPENFICEGCLFKCSRPVEWNRHIMTRKHINVYKCLQTNNTNKIFTCECGKVYNYRQSLYVHRKKCTNHNNIYEEESSVKESVFSSSSADNILNNNDSENAAVIVVDSSSNEIKVLTNLVLELVKSNTELQKQMLEVCKNNNTTINNTNHMNSHNKTFNLQFFLNEQCKDAMNLTDFVKSVQLTLPDLEKVDQEGYVNGMSNLIIAKLNELDIYKRPVHCSDAKRDTMHVKDEDKWEREDTANSKLIVAVKDIEKKNFLLLNDYKEKYPDCLDLESIHNDKYLHMMMTLAASGDNEYKKVIKKVAKEVVIEKE